MNYKEKYETALEGIREILSSGQDSIKMSRLQLRLQGIFPELNETDDEKIRKVISDILLIDSDEIREILDANNVLMQDIDAWLEKQGEKKSTDKIQFGKEYKCIASPRYSTFMTGKIYKPEDKFLCSFMNFCSDCFEPIEDSDAKFHVGDWVAVRGEVILICDIRNNLYDVMFADGEHRHYDTNILDKESRLWTIADAKDGDVLVASDGSIFIFAGVAYCACKYYVALTVYNDVSISKDVELSSWEMSNAVHPATKEQCNHLFKVMKEKGYKWYNEKKELKKIGELTSTDIANKPEPMFKVGEWVVRKDKQHFCNGSKTVQIIKIDRNMCDFDCGSWLYDKDIRPWSIYDAQVGDVLISWTNKPFIYNGFFNESVVGAYCGLNTFNRIIIADKQDYLYYNWTIKKDVRPATKQQRDLFFQKMEENGYEWDDEKKEVIKRI